VLLAKQVRFTKSVQESANNNNLKAFPLIEDLSWKKKGNASWLQCTCFILAV
jgi:hypothetical protein